MAQLDPGVDQSNPGHATGHLVTPGHGLRLRGVRVAHTALLGPVVTVTIAVILIVGNSLEEAFKARKKN